MSSINIEVLSIKTESKKNSRGGTYEEMNVAHRLEDGSIVGFKLFDFAAAPAVWNALKTAQSGAYFSVDREKDKTGKYWQWAAIHRQDAAPPPSAKPITTPTKPTYETPEERAKKQVYIIRQSSIASAVELLKDHGAQPNVDLVIKTAKAFEAYVIGKGFDDMLSDEIE